MAGCTAAGERQRETNSINRSLTVLGLVILRLTERREGSGLPVPYRDSKLTHLLQASDGGSMQAAPCKRMQKRSVHTSAEGRCARPAGRGALCPAGKQSDVPTASLSRDVPCCGCCWPAHN